MTIWLKTIKENRILQSTTVEDTSGDTRTHKVLEALEDTCREWDLSVPIWLDLNIKEFKEHARTRFTKDSFVEDVPFDFLEMQVLEEDSDE